MAAPSMRMAGEAGRGRERAGRVRLRRDRRRRRRGRSESVRSCRRGRATGRGSRRPLPTWPGRLRPGARATYCAALTLRSSSAALRPMPLGGDLDDLDHAVGVDTKVPRSARPSPSIITSKLRVIVAGRVADHRVLDLADGVRGVVPRLVGEVGVGRHRVDLDAELLELGVVVGQVAELGRADEGEVGRVEEDDRPLALQVVAR